MAWFESIKDILKTIDPGGTMLAELMDARVDIQGKRHNSISERLLADMNYLYQKLRTSLKKKVQAILDKKEDEKVKEILTE